jgi:phage-related protein
MGQSFFIWNGIDCRSHGIIQASAAPIVRAEERVKHVDIPGVAGDLTETEGENIFNSYIQTVSISVRGALNVRDVFRWLRGSGFVTFSGEPDRKQAARVIGAITLNKLSKNMDVWQGEVQFYCQPFKELLTEGTVTVTTSGATVRNNGDVSCKPVYKVTVASGQTTISLTVGGATLTVTDLTSGGVYWIDCAAMEVWNSDRTALMTRYSAGDFQELAPGDNTVTFTGCSSIEIEKRERYL